MGRERRGLPRARGMRPLRRPSMGGRGLRRGGGMRTSGFGFVDVPRGLANGHVVAEGGEKGGTETLFICPGNALSDECVKMSEENKRLYANGSLINEGTRRGGPRTSGMRRSNPRGTVSGRNTRNGNGRNY